MRIMIRRSILVLFLIVESSVLFCQKPVFKNQKEGKAYARWMEFTSERLNPGGKLADPGIFLSAAIETAEDKIVAAGLKSGFGWTPVGPTSKPGTYTDYLVYGMGRINCITFHPTNPDIYWLGVGQGGVWKTMDGGETYFPLTDKLPIIRVSDIAVDKNNPDTMYISLCDFEYMGVSLPTDGRKRPTHYGLGVYKTTDGGVTWKPTGLSFELSELDATLIRRVLISPDNPDHLLAAGVSGLFKSTNGGDTWTHLRDELIWEIEQDQNNGNLVYATSGYVQSLRKGQAALFRTSDFGNSWNELNPGFPGNRSIARVEIGLSSETQDYIYLIAADNEGGFFGFYRSTDSGDSWQTRMDFRSSGINILGRPPDGLTKGGQAWFDLAILVDPKNKERVFIGGINMWGSEDGGTTWTICSYNYSTPGYNLHVDHHQYKYNQVDQNYYACHDGGVARTSEMIINTEDPFDFKTIWEERSNGLVITSFRRLGLSKSHSGDIIAGAQDNTTMYKQNNDWVFLGMGDGGEALINPENSQIIIGSSQYGRWFRSLDGGRSIETILTQETVQEDAAFAAPMVMNQNNPQELFTGYGNVWKSENQGTDWEKISDFPIMRGYGKPAVISALAICQSSPNNIYAAKRPNFVYDYPSSFWRTHDGSNWDDVTIGLPDSLYFTYIAVDSNDPMSVWVTCSGFLDGQKVFHSKDGGLNWENVSWNLPNIPVNTIVHETGSAQNVVCIGTDTGIYYSWDSWNNWELFSTDLPNVFISELEIHYPSRKIYAATYGRGIWMADLPSPLSGTGDLKEPLSRLEVFPNPSNGSFLLSFAGLGRGDLLIQIVDIQGKEVYASSSINSNGSGRIQVDSMLNPGVYFVRLWNGLELRSTRILIN